MIKVYLLTKDLSDKIVEVFQEHTACALNELSGKDMSWRAYSRIVDDILALDKMSVENENAADERKAHSHD